MTVNALILHFQQLLNLQLPVNILLMLETSIAMMEPITKNVIGMVEIAVVMKWIQSTVPIVNVWIQPILNVKISMMKFIVAYLPQGVYVLEMSLWKRIAESLVTIADWIHISKVDDELWFLLNTTCNWNKTDEEICRYVFNVLFSFGLGMVYVCKQVYRCYLHKYTIVQSSK